jgi:hypothetical protein
LKLGSDLELLARRAAEAGRNQIAIAFYDRANRLRKLVRIDDPKNAGCACFMAKNFNALSSLYEKEGNDDEALKAKLAEVEIREDQVEIEPESGWEEVLATNALELAQLYSKRGEARSALLYATRAVAIRGNAASSHSADSQLRRLYAEALENTAKYAHATALVLPKSRKISAIARLRMALTAGDAEKTKGPARRPGLAGATGASPRTSTASPGRA